MAAHHSSFPLNSISLINHTTKTYMKSKVILCALLAMLLGTALHAEPLKIGYSDWPGYTILEVAKQKGWFKEAGLDVELVWFEYSPSIDAFAAGKVDGVT